MNAVGPSGPTTLTTRLKQTMTNDNRVLVLGDTHGAGGWVDLAVRTASALGINTILQVGDFGFWPHYGSGRVFMETTQSILGRYGIELWWVDGNHENHDWLAEQPRDDEGFWRAGPIVHIGRGSRWTWGDRTFLGCGGAYSIDKPYRREGESWWAGETITESDLLRCGTDHVDVLVTHDAPLGAQNIMGPGTVGDKDSYPESHANRTRVASLCDATSPELLVHGHYHHRNRTLYKSTRVEGFGRDGDALGAMGVLNLDDLTIDSINPYVATRAYDRPELVEAVDDDF